MDLTRAGGALGIPGLYVTGEPGASDEAAKQGSLSIRLGLGQAESHAFFTGQCPVMRYIRQLMMAILHDRVQIAKNVNATVIGLDEALRSTAASRGQSGKSASSACILSSDATCDVRIQLGVRGATRYIRTPLHTGDDC